MLCMLVAGCKLYRNRMEYESKNRTQMELFVFVVVLVPDLPLLITVSSLVVC